MPHGVFSVCVYCGARDGDDPAYAEEAEAVGQLLAARGWRLVYGAGDVGLMGRVARAAQAGGGATLGVIPQHLMVREVGKRDLDTLVVTETMHERKKLMMENADAVIALPGGIGTMDELVEAITWRQLEITPKPVFLLDAHGYFGPFLGLMRHIIDSGFADPDLVDLYEVVSSPQQAIARIGAVLENGQARVATG